jgi:cobalamin transport system ATP-binding protein
MTVAEYVLLGRTPYVPYFGTESRSDVEAVERALRRLDLTALASRRLGTLSGGERQRAVLARALAQGTEVLLLDEPTSALDVGRQQQVLEFVDRLRAQQRLTVLSAMHDLTLAAQYAERLLLLDGGVVVADGPPREVVTEARVAAHYGATVRVIDDEAGLAVVPRR